MICYSVWALQYVGGSVRTTDYEGKGKHGKDQHLVKGLESSWLIECHWRLEKGHGVCASARPNLPDQGSAVLRRVDGASLSFREEAVSKSRYLYLSASGVRDGEVGLLTGEQYKNLFAWQSAYP